MDIKVIVDSGIVVIFNGFDLKSFVIGFNSIGVKLDGVIVIF